MFSSIVCVGQSKALWLSFCLSVQYDHTCSFHVSYCYTLLFLSAARPRIAGVSLIKFCYVLMLPQNYVSKYIDFILNFPLYPPFISTKNFSAWSTHMPVLLIARYIGNCKIIDFINSIYLLTNALSLYSQAQTISVKPYIVLSVMGSVENVYCCYQLTMFHCFSSKLKIRLQLCLLQNKFFIY